MEVKEPETDIFYRLSSLEEELNDKERYLARVTKMKDSIKKRKEDLARLYYCICMIEGTQRQLRDFEKRSFYIKFLSTIKKFVPWLLKIKIVSKFDCSYQETQARYENAVRVFKNKACKFKIQSIREFYTQIQLANKRCVRLLPKLEKVFEEALQEIRNLKREITLAARYFTIEQMTDWKKLSKKYKIAKNEDLMELEKKLTLEIEDVREKQKELKERMELFQNMEIPLKCYYYSNYLRFLMKNKKPSQNTVNSIKRRLVKVIKEAVRLKK